MKRIAIVGFGQTREMTPWGDKSAEIWTLNMHGVPRCDRRYELHARAVIEEESRPPEPNYLAALQGERGYPIVMLEQHTDIPMSERLPIESMVAYFGEFIDKLKAQPYFTSSIAYMTAAAIMELCAARANRWTPEGEEIQIFGVDLLDDEEYAHQRSNEEFLIGFAAGRGIRLVIPTDSALLDNTGLYGYEDDALRAHIGKAGAYLAHRRKVLEQELAAAKNQVAQALKVKHAIDGQLAELEECRRALTHLQRGGTILLPEAAR